MKRIIRNSLILMMGLGFSSAALAQTYKVDPSHAGIAFKVTHMGFSNTYGLLGGAEGSFTINEAKPEASSFDISVKTDTINTLEKKRDEHLRGPDFFNSKVHPKISLKSKTVKKLDAKKFEIVADLTMNGVTKPITFVYEIMKTGTDPFQPTMIRTGGETKFKVKRSDYNMSYMSKPGEIGDEVEMMVSIEGTRNK